MIKIEPLRFNAKEHIDNFISVFGFYPITYLTKLFRSSPNILIKGDNKYIKFNQDPFLDGYLGGCGIDNYSSIYIDDNLVIQFKEEELPINNVLIVIEKEYKLSYRVIRS